MLLDFILRGRTGHPLLPQLKEWRYAHRGYHDKPQIPENSLPAFKRAIENGWGAELDIHILRDGTLAVFHDSDLKRCTGVEGIIEDLDRGQLAKLRLEGTDYPVPLFDEVLALFEGVAPLIIELKTYKGNHRALAEAACKRLDSYCGLFCVESFDPRAIADVRELRPAICTGQLSQDFEKDKSGLPWYQRFILTNLLFNVKTRPDFIAYKFEDRGKRNNRRVTGKLGVQPVNWTIRSKKDLDACESAGGIPIFEKFDPRG